MKGTKRFGAILLTICLICQLIVFEGNGMKVYAGETEGISSGSTYIIKSAMDQTKAIMPTNSVPAWTYVTMFDKTGSNSQKWKVEYNGSSYNIQNVGTGYHLHYGEGVKDAHVDQNGFDGSDFYKWNLVKASSSSYPSGYMLEAVRKDGEGNPVYATASGSENGVEIYLRSKDDTNEASQIWYFESVDNVENASVTEDKMENVARAYLDKYLVDTTQSDGTIKKSLGGGFWIGAELCEMMLDGYETTGDNLYRSAFESSYQDLLDNIGNRYSYWTDMTETDWRANPFNDDVMWLVIASVRAHLLFGSSNNGYRDYLTYAENNFNMVIERGMLADGTIRWSHEEGRGEGTTSCINGPTVVAACYLAKATGKEEYYELARSIHAAQRIRMFNAETGQVYDSPDSEAPTTYNAGTWLGSCVMLFEKYGNQEYLDDAIKTMDFVIKNNGRFCNSHGIMTHEDSTEGDLSAFRAILMRYIRKFIVEMDKDVDMTKYIRWMQKNAKVAYNNRNSSGLILNPWFRAATNSADYGSSGMSGGVSLLINLPTYSDTVKKHAYERIEAEDFDYAKGIMTERTQDVDGNRQLGGIQNGYHTGYSNVQFGEMGAANIKMRVSTAVNGGYVEVRLDSLNGALIGTVDLPYTGDWNTYETITCEIEPVTGSHTVYLVYKNDEGNYVCNLNWIEFTEKALYQVKYYTQNTDMETYTEVPEDSFTENSYEGATVSAPEKIYTGFTKNTAKSIESGMVVSGESLVLQVYYDRNTYRIRYEGIDDIRNEGDLPGQYVYGIGTTLQDALREGYEFGGWYMEAGCENLRESISPEEMGDITLYAKFIPAEEDEGNTEESSEEENTEGNPGEGSTEDSSKEEDTEGTPGEGSTEELPKEEDTEGNSDKEEGSTEEPPKEEDTEGDPDKEEGSTEEPPKEEDTEGNPDKEEGNTEDASKEEDTEGKPGEESTEESPKEEGTEGNPDKGEGSTEESTKEEDTGKKPGQDESQSGSVTEKPDNAGGQSGAANTDKLPEGNQSGNSEVRPSILLKGDTFVSGRFTYKITKLSGKQGTVELTGVQKKNYKTLTIPNSVKYMDITFKVTSIGKNAFMNNKKLKTVTIGKEIIRIASKAFYGCKKLSTVKVKSRKMKKIGKNAFIKTGSKLKIKVPMQKYVSKYKKLFGKKVPKNIQIIKM